MFLLSPDIEDKISPYKKDINIRNIREKNQDHRKVEKRKITKEKDWGRKKGNRIPATSL